METKRNKAGDPVRAKGNKRSDTKPLKLSERDFLRVIALLENPPVPNATMIAAARVLARLDEN